jgi:hypothetical protein
MKEEVGIGFDFSQGILHGTETSRRCAEGQRAIRETREITPKKAATLFFRFAFFGVFIGRSRSAPQWPKRPLSNAPKCDCLSRIEGLSTDVHFALLID